MKNVLVYELHCLRKDEFVSHNRVFIDQSDIMNGLIKTGCVHGST